MVKRNWQKKVRNDLHARVTKKLKYFTIGVLVGKDYFRSLEAITDVLIMSCFCLAFKTMSNKEADCLQYCFSRTNYRYVVVRYNGLIK